MKRFLIGCFLSLLLVSCGGTFRPSSTTSLGTIMGTITDSETGYPVSDVAISVDGTRYGAMTGKDGTFVIERVPIGRYTLKILHIDYDKVYVRSVTVQTGRSTIVDRKLVKKQASLNQQGR